jgi:hypothetical protein
MSTKHWLILLLLIGGVLRLWQLGDKSFWVDEISTVHYSQELGEIVPYCKKHNTPPLRYFLVHYLARSPRAETMTRLPSALCGILSLPLLFLLADRLFDRRVAVIAVALLAFSPWQIYHAQDGRMYAVFVFFVILSLHLLFLALEEGKVHYWALLGLVFALNGWLTYFGLWVAFFILLFLLSLLLLNFCSKARPAEPEDAENSAVPDADESGDSHLPDVPSRPAVLGYRVLAKGIIVCYFAAALGYAPWVPNLRHLFQQYQPPSEIQQTAPPTPQNALPAVQGDQPIAPPPQLTMQKIRFIPFLTTYNWNYLRGLLQDFSCSNAFAGFALAGFFLLGMGLCFRANRQFLLLALVWIGGLSLILYLKPSIRFLFPSRYLIYLHLVFIIMAALGIWRSVEAVAGLLQWLLKRLHMQSPKWLKRELLGPALAVVLAALIALACMVDNVHYYRSEKQDWRAACNYLSAVAQPYDALITGQAWTNFAVDYYYTPEMTTLHRFEEQLDLKVLRETLENNDRIWFINWGPIPPLVQLYLDPHLVLDKTFPGLEGEIQVYRRRRVID